MTVEDELHHLVDQLNEDAADALLEYAEWLAAEEDDPLSEEELVVSVRARRRSPQATT